MGLFGNKQTEEKPLYETSYVGFWIKVYPNRVDFKAYFAYGQPIYNKYLLTKSS